MSELEIGDHIIFKMIDCVENYYLGKIIDKEEIGNNIFLHIEGQNIEEDLKKQKVEDVGIYVSIVTPDNGWYNLSNISYFINQKEYKQEKEEEREQEQAKQEKKKPFWGRNGQK